MPDSKTIKTKQEALKTIESLMTEHSLSLQDIKSYNDKSPDKEKNNKWLQYVLGYLGAAFIFCGLGLYITMIWDDLSGLSRVIITYGSGIAAYIMAYIFFREEKFIKLSTPFYFMSALLLPIGMFVYLAEFSDGNDVQLASIVIFGILALQYAIPYLKLQKTSLLFLAYLFFNLSLCPFLERIGLSVEVIGITVGVSIMVFSAYFAKTAHSIITPIWFVLGCIGYLVATDAVMSNVRVPDDIRGLVLSLTIMVIAYGLQKSKTNIYHSTPVLYLIGAIGFFFSLFNLVENIAYVDLLLIITPIYMMMMSLKLKSRTLLTVSTLALIAYLGYFTEEYFADVTGWPIALIIMGFMLIGVSTYAVKLGQKIKRKS